MPACQQMQFVRAVSDRAPPPGVHLAAMHRKTRTLARNRSGHKGRTGRLGRNRALACFRQGLTDQYRLRQDQGSILRHRLCFAGGPQTQFPDGEHQQQRTSANTGNGTFSRAGIIPVSYTHLTLPTICSV